MRALPVFVITAGLAALVACGEGSAFDNGFRTSYREKAVEGCTTGARGAVPAGINLNLQRVCECAVDRHMQGKSATELMRDDDQQAAQAATRQCLTEELARVQGGAGQQGPKPAG